MFVKGTQEQYEYYDVYRSPPPENTDLLVIDANADGGGKPVIAYYEAGKWYSVAWWDCSLYSKPKVTHWSYIPKLPKDKNITFILKKGVDTKRTKIDIRCDAWYGKCQRCGQIVMIDSDYTNVVFAHHKIDVCDNCMEYIRLHSADSNEGMLIMGEVE